MARGLKIIVIVLMVVMPQVLLAGIVGSKHDLGVTNLYSTEAGYFWNSPSNEICVFCHTPHGGDVSKGPLWNRKITDMGSFQMYSSPTMDSSCSATPSPVSLACLSCHDSATGGAVSAGDTHDALLNNSNNDPWGSGYFSEPNCMACHPNGGVKEGPWWQVGPNLRDDHPISMVYADAYATDGELHLPPNFESGWADVKLFDGRVECPSCHNPHDPTYDPFLRKDNSTSGLCKTCHIK